MKQSLLEKLEIFVYNQQSIKKAYFLEDARISGISAALFLENDKRVETEEIKKAKEILANHANVFSNFRGYVSNPIHCMLANTTDPEYVMKQALIAYDDLKEVFPLLERTFLPIVAMDLALHDRPDQYKIIAKKAKEIFSRLNKVHPLLTDDADELTCAILAKSDLSVDEAVNRTLKAYDTLKQFDFGFFKSGDALFTIAQIIALSRKDIQVCTSRTYDIFDLAKKEDHKFDNSYELAVIGALAILDDDIHALMTDLIDVDAYLAEQKDYQGLLGFTKKNRMAHAAVIVASERAQSSIGVTAAIQAAVSEIILETIILMSVIVASSSHSSSSSSSH